MASVIIYNKQLSIWRIWQLLASDEKWFLFVLGQLLGNAVKYTAKDGSGILDLRRVGRSVPGCGG